ncbi:isochorismate synthase [Bacillus taeanensis]|uniref:Isochorismate synthase MenF n=1 Tax=Bacillus taeanensis TaxID=273032 RepID=A0A366XYV1_9BACI|nr:isochorismate synthase [Bacillus taeanensis]RBW71332.1 isochorismate synthase [Bacillus taeanensis]
MVGIQQHELHNLLVQGVERACKQNTTVLVSHTIEVKTPVHPFSFFTSGSHYKGSRSFWSDPTGEFQLVGLGTCIALNSNFSKRFRGVEKEWKELLQSSIIHAPNNEPGTGPTLIGGFSFDPLKPKTELWRCFPDTRMTLPTFMLTVNKEKTWLTINALLDEENHPSTIANQLMKEQEMLLKNTDITLPEPAPFYIEEIVPQEWMRTVEKTAKQIQEGIIEKLVLAREVRIHSEEVLSAESILFTLYHQQPQSYLFAFESENDCFLGASPERLVKREGDRFLSTCLAGSIRRGVSKEEDIQLGESLLNDEKNRHEHQLVVDMIKEAMVAVCEEVYAPTEPILYKARDIQHLYTPVTAKADNHSLLAVVEQLHPTPALGGYPQKEAVKKLREMEKLDRGWYAGPIGWIDYRQDGEFAVAIRSGLLQGKEASLFAGCGIVGDSDPLSEYKETQIKLQPMLSALRGNHS